MRERSIKQAKDEIEVLDAISVSLRDALRTNYDSLRSDRLSLGRGGDDVEIAAQLHNIRVGFNEALEEIARRGYGRVVFVREEDEAGKLLRNGVYRVSQANAQLPEAGIKIISSKQCAWKSDCILPNWRRYRCQRFQPASDPLLLRI